jgi:nitronate monooxygenase
VLSGRPARGLLSPFIAEGEQLPAGLRRRPTRGPTTPAKQLHAAASRGGRSDDATQYAAHWAGQGAPLARALPAAALIDTLVAEMAQPAQA